MIEIPLAILALLISLPLILILTLWIRIDSPGNPFFIQRRPGLNGNLFVLFKLRSMRPSLPEQPLKLNTINDNRVTGPGKWMRKLHLDELPQLLNVILGNMSFIGPRPVPAALYDFYKNKIEDYDRRHIIKPGITGFAQAWQGYTDTLEGEALKWKYDTYYINEVSLSQDLKVLKSTLLPPDSKEKMEIRKRVLNFHHSGREAFEPATGYPVVACKLS